MQRRWCLPLTALTLTTTSAVAQPAPDIEISVRDLPEQRIVVRDVQGSYDLHSQVFQEAFMYLAQQGLSPAGAPLGVYFNDPAEVAVEELRWQIGLPIGDAELDAADPYRVETLSAVKAVVYDTVLADLDACEPIVAAWLAEHDLQEAGPTRMVYPGMHPDPELMPVRVVTPVRDRGSFTLADCAFMAGEWATELGSSTLLERWSEPQGDSMLGALQWVREDAVWMYELMSIQQRDDGVYFLLRHFDRDFTPWESADSPIRSKLTEADEHRALFLRQDDEGDVGGFEFVREGATFTVRLLPRDEDGDIRTFRFRKVD